MSTMASQITSLAIVYSDADQRKQQSSASLAFVWGIQRWPVNSPHKWPETWKMFPFDDVIMSFWTRVSGRLHLPFMQRNQCRNTRHMKNRCFVRDTADTNCKFAHGKWPWNLLYLILCAASANRRSFDFNNGFNNNANAINDILSCLLANF